MNYWIIIFFSMAVISRFLFHLPSPVWRVLIILPYIGAFFESIKPFTNQILLTSLAPRDGLTDFFASLVTFIGVWVCIYASDYFKHDERKRFFPLMYAFSGCMLGVLWTDNIFVFYAFWEATALCSFLLIGFRFYDLESGKGAKQAFIVNMAGGLCLLLALIILNQNTGSTSLSVILRSKDRITENVPLLMSMIILAAMIKSAQFPFHFWLPKAMTAPTPVSCYLHSATMVKLGLFLLTRMSPLFFDSIPWILILNLFGTVTLIWGIVVSLTKSDLKQLFAWTTVSSLGGMCILVGLHVPYSWRAFVSYVLAHSLFKSSLFLCVGNIDKQLGGRSVDHITGLLHRMPLTSLAMLMGLGSMMGLPLSLGFLGKEYLFKSALQLRGPGSFLIVAVLGASILSFVVAYRLILLIFKKRSDVQELKEVGISMWLPPLLLASAGWMIGFFLDGMNKYLLSPVVSSIVQEPVEQSLEMWSGLSVTLLLSTVTFAVGLYLTLKHQHLLMHFALWMNRKIKTSHRIGLLGSFFKKVIDRLQDGRLSHYLSWGLGTSFIFVTLVIYSYSMEDFSKTVYGETVKVFQKSNELQLVSFLLLVLGLLILVKKIPSLMSVIGLGVVGFGVSLMYLSFGATDLAMTQMAVEAISILILTLSMVFLRSNPGGFSTAFTFLRALVTGAVFVGSIVLCVILDDVKQPSLLNDFLKSQAFPLGKGHNIVNVILVDFRALDTFGEITVLGIVSLGIHSLFFGKKKLHLTLQKSPLLDTSVKVFIPVFNIISFLLLVRGHNAPGGGFAAGLLLAISHSFYSLIHGERWARTRLYLEPESWVVTGLFVSFFAGLLGYFRGGSFLTPHWLPPPLDWLGTPHLFDLGVYLLVLGMGTSLYFSFLRKAI